MQQFLHLELKTSKEKYPSTFIHSIVMEGKINNPLATISQKTCTYIPGNADAIKQSIFDSRTNTQVKKILMTPEKSNRHMSKLTYIIRVQNMVK
jgi:hypothetical protein